MTLQAIKWNNGKLEILDQLLLPLHSNYIEITGVKDGWNAIYKMQVRGAPAIAIVGCLSLVTEIELIPYADKKSLLQDIKDKLEYLITARPTAVNIKLAADELICLATKLSNEIISPADMKESLVAEKLFYETRDSPPESKPRAARWFVNKPFRTRVIRHITSMLKKDVEDNESIGEYGATEILKLNPNQNLVTIITHCNTGSLATAGYGTALGVVRSLHNSGKLEQVYCTETRPYNQGARLTAYELVHDKIPSTLICDNMVASLMRTKKISAVVVGADRVVANGDTANKIGTYQIAVLAKYHKVPFFIAAPFTTIDFSLPNGDCIKIEERPETELSYINGIRIAAEGIKCWNPAFDVTPADLITGIITEKGVYEPGKLVSLRN